MKDLINTAQEILNEGKVTASNLPGKDVKFDKVLNNPLVAAIVLFLGSLSLALIVAIVN